MNATITKARELRASPEPHIVPSELYMLAKDDAQAILDGLRVVPSAQVGSPDAALLLLHAHLTVRELAAVIYRHAMIEAGAVVEAISKEPYDICPVCAHDFTVPL